MTAAPLTQTEWQVRHGVLEDRNRILPLIYFEPYVHQQPGWRPILDYVNSPSVFLLLQQKDHPQAVWLASIEDEGISWLRLFAVAQVLSPEKAWALLWEQARPSLQKARVRRLYVLAVKEWTRTFFEEMGFQQVSSVRNMAWPRQPLPPRRALPPQIALRPMQPADLEAVLALDHLAFREPWKMSASDLEQVYQEAVISTVAEGPEGLVGYQISTLSVRGGHLARLAVHPAAQRQGIGFALVYDALSYFAREKAEWVTVNTWCENQAAVALYRHFGFHFLPEKHPLYRLDIAPEGA